jgi:hypothetical protein
VNLAPVNYLNVTNVLAHGLHEVPGGTKEDARMVLPSLPGLDAGLRAATQS